MHCYWPPPPPLKSLGFATQCYFKVWCVKLMRIERGPFHKYRLSLIPAWLSNHMPSKVWNEITYPFSNFNSCTELWEWINSNFITLNDGSNNYLCMLGLASVTGTINNNLPINLQVIYLFYESPGSCLLIKQTAMNYITFLYAYYLTTLCPYQMIWPASCSLDC